MVRRMGLSSCAAFGARGTWECMYAVTNNTPLSPKSFRIKKHPYGLRRNGGWVHAKESTYKIGLGGSPSAQKELRQNNNL
jgi:hypothetical protein